ncbi:hypothetical protein DCC62_00885 [candidate division KSB1 bacterium]|nr:MAG: hypothetical protein DCC62_00885 [candidate division KSB1 bacterium]
MSTIFLSYSHADAPFVHRLHGDLTKRGLTVWIDETSIPPGAVMSEKIVEGINNCAYFIVTLSAEAVQSAWVRQECAMAVARSCQGHGCALIPLLRRDCEIPLSFQARRYLDFRKDEDYATNLELLLRHLPPTLAVFDALGREADWDEGLHCVGTVSNIVAHPDDPNEISAKAMEIAQVAAPFLAKGAAFLPPGYAPLASAVIAILHGMLGYPPRILWSFKPPERARFLISTKYALDLQALRDQGKQMDIP